MKRPYHWLQAGGGSHTTHLGFLPLILLLLTFPACNDQTDTIPPDSTKIMDALKERRYRVTPPAEAGANELPPPTKVTLEGKLVSREAVESLKKQTGYEMAIYGNPSTVQHSFELQEVPFWKAVLEVRNKFEFHLDLLGDTLLFKPGSARRAPVEVVGPVMISRRVEIQQGEGIRKLIDQLQTSNPSVRREVTAKLQEQTGESFEGDFETWNVWYEEGGKYIYPPTRIKERNIIYLEIWQEPKIGGRPLFRFPRVSYTMRDRTKKEMYMERQEENRNRWVWKIQPPISGFSKAAGTLKGTAFLNVESEQATVTVPFREGAEILPKNRPSMRLHVNRVNRKEDVTTMNLAIWQDVTITNEERKHYREIKEKMERAETRENYPSSSMDQFIRVIQKTYLDVLEARVSSGDENDPNGQIGRITGQERDSLSEHTFQIRVPGQRSEEENLQLSLSLGINEQPVRFSLKPIYLYPKEPRFQDMDR